MTAPERKKTLPEKIAERILRERLTVDGRWPPAKQIRNDRLIPPLRGEVMAAREYLAFPDGGWLSFDDVAKRWALLRQESPLHAAKVAALADLLEAAFDGHLPQLRYLHPGCGVEYLRSGRWCSDDKCVLYRPEDEGTAHLDSAKLGQMRDCSPLSDGGAYLLDQVAPYCFARRSAVGAFLIARGVDQARLPKDWRCDLAAAPDEPWAPSEPAPEPEKSSEPEPPKAEAPREKQPRQRGKLPIIFKFFAEQRSGAIESEAFELRKALRDDLRKYHPQLKTLSYETLRKAIEKYNSHLKDLSS